MKNRTRSLGWYVAGAFLLGTAVGLLATGSPRDQALLGDSKKEGRSLFSKMMSRLPLRVKLAGAIGAVKGAGSKAYHMRRRHAARTARA